MELSSLKIARGHEIGDWLTESLKLTPYQQSILSEEYYDILRISPFYFYKDTDENKTTFLWRMTVVFWPIVFILVNISLPFVFVVSGKWGYNRWFIDKIIAPWLQKSGLK